MRPAALVSVLAVLALLAPTLVSPALASLKTSWLGGVQDLGAAGDNNTDNTNINVVASNATSLKKECSNTTKKIIVKLLNYTISRIKALVERLEARNITIPKGLAENIEKLENLNMTSLSCREALTSLNRAQGLLKALVMLSWKNLPGHRHTIVSKAVKKSLAVALERLWRAAKITGDKNLMRLVIEARGALARGDLKLARSLIKKAWIELEAREATRITAPLVAHMFKWRHQPPESLQLPMVFVEIADRIGFLAVKFNASSEAVARAAASIEALVSAAEAKLANNTRLKELAARAIAEAEEAIKRVEETISSLNNTNTSMRVQEAKTLLEKAENLLDQAKNSFNQSSYVMALVEAKTAKGLAVAAYMMLEGKPWMLRGEHRPWMPQPPRWWKHKLVPPFTPVVAIAERIELLNQTIETLYAKAMEANNTVAVKALEKARSILAEALKALKDGKESQAISLYMKAFAIVVHVSRELGVKAKLLPIWGKTVKEEYEKLIEELEKKIAELRDKINKLREKAKGRMAGKLLDIAEKMLEKAETELEKAKKLLELHENPLPAITGVENLVKIVEKLLERIKSIATP